MTRPSTPLRLGAAAVLALAVAGCGMGAGAARNPFAPAGSRGDDGRVQVHVENQNFGDATIHAYRGSERFRLGEVVGKTEKSFTVRWSFTLPMEFDIHITGGGDCRVRAIAVDPGDQIWVRIPPQITLSPCYSGKE